MKKSRIAKLSLMGASIAALAATLTTSTYAWYVSNKTASVTGGTGTTGTAGADGSIMLSWKNGADAVWMKELNLSASGSTLTKPAALQPVSYYTASGTPAGAAGDGFYEIGATGAPMATKSTNVITFDYYVKAGKAGTASIAFTWTNSTTGSLPTQMLYVDSAGKSAGAEVSVDVLDALGVQQIVDTGSAAYIVPTGYTSKTTSGFAPTSSNGAAQYYSTVSGNTLTANAAPMGSATSFANLTLAAETAYHLSYTIFLDGGDYSCYNACQGQNFTWTIKYTFTETPAQG